MVPATWLLAGSIQQSSAVEKNESLYVSTCNNSSFSPLELSKRMNSFSCIFRTNAEASCRCLLRNFGSPIGMKKVSSTPLPQSSIKCVQASSIRCLGLVNFPEDISFCRSLGLQRICACRPFHVSQYDPETIACRLWQGQWTVHAW